MRRRREAAELAGVIEAGGVAGGEAVAGLVGRVGTSVASGLSSEAVAERRRDFGGNATSRRAPVGFWRHALNALGDATLLVLLSAGAVSLGIGLYEGGDDDGGGGGWVEGAAIIAAVVVVVGVTASNDAAKERQFEALNDAQESDLRARCIRDGAVQPVAHADLVVGDVLRLEGGDKVPADCVCVEAHDLLADESSMTGEAEPSRKVPGNALLSGTHVAEGFGTAVVCAVGALSVFGKLAGLVVEPRPRLPRRPPSSGGRNWGSPAAYGSCRGRNGPPPG